MEPRKFNGYPKTDTGKQSKLNFPLSDYKSLHISHSLNLEKLHPPAEVLKGVPNADHLLRVPVYSDSLVFLTQMPQISQVFILEKLG